MGRTIHSVLRNAVQKYPNKIFLYEGNRSLTFQQLDEVTDRLANALINQGIKKGDHIGLLALNQLEWLMTFFAATKIGVGVVALSPRYRESELIYMLNQSEAKAVISINQFADFNYSDMFHKLMPKLNTVEKYIFIGAGFEGSISFQSLLDYDADELIIEGEHIDKDDLAIMIFTSGTTGKPKGVMITHGSIIASAQAQADHFEIDENDVFVGSVPLNHVGGITCTIMASLLTCSSVVLVPFFNPKLVLSTIEDYQVTIFAGVPTMYLMVLNEESINEVNFDSVRLAIVGGSNLEPELANKISSIIPNAQFVNLYGLSESSGACVLSKLTDSLEKVQTTIGVPIGNFEVKVVDQDRNPLPIGEPGELAIRGDCVAKGYYRFKEKTKETFTSDGWLYTGDIVSIDKDGYLSYKGRVHEMFIQGGFNVYPVEVENILTTHPHIQLAAGFGIPDEFLGEVGLYYIVPQPGKSITVDEIIEFSKQHLADYKVPRKIEIVNELPMTPAGKIHKSLLKSEYLDKITN